MNRSHLILSIICLANWSTHAQSGYFSIPRQVVNIEDLLDSRWLQNVDTISGFELSTLITLGEYKEYLSEIKKDSSERYYLTQLPDSSVGDDKVRKKYMKKKVYESYPVVGISWENALNYCKWKTVKGMELDSAFLYRLPLFSEWLSAFKYLTATGLENDLNQSYSDWTMSSNVDVDYGGPKNEFETNYEEVYLHKFSDSPSLKRKLVVGNSFHFAQVSSILYKTNFPAFQGCSYVGFRLIREPMQHSEISDNSFQVLLFNYWGI